MNPRLFRLLGRAKGAVNRTRGQVLRDAEKSQWLSRDELHALAWDKQRKLVAYAHAQCPFYRRKYDSVGFHPGDLRRPEDFSLIPVLVKDEVRNHLDDMLAIGIDESRLRERFTGGSTGVPLRVYQDASTDRLMQGIQLRTTASWGLKAGAKTAHIWGLNRLNQAFLHTQQSWFQRFVTNYVLLDAFDMSAEKMAGFADLLRRFRPELVISYTSAMVAFARFIEERGGGGVLPQVIWLTSEPTHDFQKELIERVCHGNVYRQYGSVEIPFYSAECGERNGLHVNSDFRTLEVVEENGRGVAAGEMGQVVVTDLENWAVPLIRYRNDDMACLLEGDCPCGRGLPLMSEVTGRTYDMFVLPNGTQVYGHRFTTFFYDHMSEVRNFQVHQTHRDRVVVRIVPEEGCPRQRLAAQVLEAFHEYTQRQVDFEIEFVDDIPSETSGKFRFVKSEVHHVSTR